LNYTFIFRQQFYFIISGLKITGHGNPDNNLESPCVTSGQDIAATSLRLKVRIRTKIDSGKSARRV
jgi:hypothetical protein